MVFQTTLKNKAVFTGIGLHSGTPTSLTLRPAEAGTGIVFHRVDLIPAVSIEACAAHVVSTRLSTTIGRNGATVATIEHLMAALRGCGIDNVHVDIAGPEVPIMDGSAAPFVEGIAAAGTKTLSRPRKYLVVRKPVTVCDGDKKATIIPSRYFKITFDMRFNHPVVDSQYRTARMDNGVFETEYAAARTFGFLAEVEALKAHGLARGGSLENAVVIGDDRIMNEDGLRYEDEFVRHKILDSVGDIALAGYHIFGHVKAYKSGHELNHRLVTELLNRPDCWRLMEFGDAEKEASLFPLAMPEMVWSEAS